MSAGLTNKQCTDKTYKFLKRIQRELTAAGVHTQYCKGTQYRRAHLVHFQGEGSVETDGGFNVQLVWSRLSNGETIGCARVYLVHDGETIRYGTGWSGGTFDHGLERVKQLFGRPAGNKLSQALVELVELWDTDREAARQFIVKAGDVTRTNGNADELLVLIAGYYLVDLPE